MRIFFLIVVWMLALNGFSSGQVRRAVAEPDEPELWEFHPTLVGRIRRAPAEVDARAATMRQDTPAEDAAHFIVNDVDSPAVRQALVRLLFNNNLFSREYAEAMNRSDVQYLAPRAKGMMCLSKYFIEEAGYQWPRARWPDHFTIPYVRSWVIRMHPEMLEAAGVDRQEAIELLRQDMAALEGMKDTQSERLGVALEILLPDDAPAVTPSAVDHATDENDVPAETSESGHQNISDPNQSTIQAEERQEDFSGTRRILFFVLGVLALVVGAWTAIRYRKTKAR